MNDKEIIERRIVLKRQHISLFIAENRDKPAWWLRHNLKIKYLNLRGLIELLAVN